MAYYSPHVVARAMERVAPYAPLARCLELDFRNPVHGLAYLRGKVLFAHTCNLYDNLPTDELLRVGDRAYEPLVRASITPREPVLGLHHVGILVEDAAVTRRRQTFRNAASHRLHH
jgi:hypothetical protein